MAEQKLVRFVVRLAGVWSLAILLAKFAQTFGVTLYNSSGSTVLICLAGVALWLQAEWAWRKGK